MVIVSATRNVGGLALRCAGRAIFLEDLCCRKRKIVKGSTYCFPNPVVFDVMVFVCDHIADANGLMQAGKLRSNVWIMISQSSRSLAKNLKFAFNDSAKRTRSLELLERLSFCGLEDKCSRIL